MLCQSGSGRQAGYHRGLHPKDLDVHSTRPPPPPQTTAPAPDPERVLRWSDAHKGAIRSLMTRFGLEIRNCPPGAPIPGSYWGESEAGLVGSDIHVRPDTPVHSLLHEACHFVCMDPARRLALHTDAGGDYAEEDAVCCLQILLAGEVPGLGRERMMADMDAWGYTFRLGSARAWFEEDAAEARGWLQCHGLTDGAGRPTWSVRRE